MRLAPLQPAVIAFLGAASSIAGAEPDPGTATTEPTPTFVSEPAPPPPPPPASHATREVAVPADRPNEIAFAIGVGYVRPPGGSFDLENPNLASARLRLISGLTFEPIVTIANSSSNVNTGVMTTTDTASEFQLGTLVRLPMITHGHVDFELIGSVSLDVLKDDPDGDYNTKTTTNLNLGWGIGIAYWLGRHWQLSTTATNPLATYSGTTTEVGPMVSTKTSSTSFGLTFDPTVYVMIHLYN